MSDIFLIDGVRSAIGSYLGQFKKTEAINLGKDCVSEIIKRNSKLQINDIEGLILEIE